MKLLLIKTEGSTPLDITSKHLELIRSVSEDLEVVLASLGDKVKIQKKLGSYDVIAGTSPTVASILSEENIKNLKWIHLFSAGVEKVLTPEVIKSKIMVSNSSGIHAIPIAEHVLGMMLIFTRRFYNSFRMQQQKVWKKDPKVSEIRGKTALIVGLGNIGMEIARLTSCFKMNVLAIKQSPENKPDFVNSVYSAKELDKALPKADFVIISLPLTPRTKHLFNLEKFKLMKKSAILINIGRGGLVNEKELIEALEKKIIGGAGLDVTEEEPLPEKSRLWEIENVIITPHHSGWSEKYMDRAIDLFRINLKAYLNGKKLPNQVDKKLGY